MKLIPKFSLIIPTRNGAKYVSAPIESILSQDFQDMELIVSVNHSDDDTLVCLKKYSDSRLKVIIPPRLLSMGSHYEWCLQQAKGEWVTIIGDDDGVMPYFFDEAVKLLERWSGSNVDAFSFRRAYYFWPGCDAVYGDSVLSISGQRREHTMWPKMAILRAILFDLNHFDLPQIYTNNLVRRDLIEKIRLQSGGIFYHELNPDVYSGVAVALLAKKWVRFEWPLFWTGTSPKSIGLATSGNSNNSTSQKNLNINESFQGRNQDSIDRSREFFNLSQSDGIGVAPQVGIKAWQVLRSSPLWVLSAMLKSPLISPNVVRMQRFFILGACACTSFLIKKNLDQFRHTEQQDILKEILRINNINLQLFSIVRYIFLISELVNYGRRGIWLLRKIAKRHEVIDIRSKSHADYPDLITAHKVMCRLNLKDKTISGK